MLPPPPPPPAKSGTLVQSMIGRRDENSALTVDRPRPIGNNIMRIQPLASFSSAPLPHEPLLDLRRCGLLIRLGWIRTNSCDWVAGGKSRILEWTCECVHVCPYCPSSSWLLLLLNMASTGINVASRHPIAFRSDAACKQTRRVARSDPTRYDAIRWRAQLAKHRSCLSHQFSGRRSLAAAAINQVAIRSSRK
jgi:hypothetical protein